MSKLYNIELEAARRLTGAVTEQSAGLAGAEAETGILIRPCDKTLVG